MAVSTSTPSLQNVVDELPNTQTSLQDCVNDAISANYNNLYYTAPATSLAEFRGYTHVTITVTAWSMTTAFSTALGACGGLTNVTKYKTGLAFGVGNGDVFYNESNAATKFNGGSQYYGDDKGKSFIVSSVGVVSSVALC